MKLIDYSKEKEKKKNRMVEREQNGYEHMSYLPP